MTDRTWISILIALALWLGGCGGGGGGGSAGGTPAPLADRFVVSGNNDGTLSVLRVDTTSGFAQAVAYVDGPGFAARDLVFDGANERLIHLTSSFVDVVDVDTSNGRVIAQDSRATSGFSSHLALGPGGSVVYVASGTSSGSIDVYTIDAAGTLGPNVPVASAIDPDYMTLNPAGDRLYVVSRTDDRIDVYGISADGSLADGPMMIDTDENPTALVFNASGDVAYLTRADSSGDSLEVLDVADDGGLTQRDFFDVDSSPIDLVLDADDDNLYVLEAGDKVVYHFNVDDDGDLTETDSHNLNFTPTDLALSPTGATLHVSHSEEDLVSTIAVDSSDGTLTVQDWVRVFDNAQTVATVGGNGTLEPTATFLLAPDREGLSRYEVGSGGGLTLATREDASHALLDGEVAVDYYSGLLFAAGANAAEDDLLVSYDFDPSTGATGFLESVDATVSDQSDFQRIELGRSGRFMYILDVDILDSFNNEQGFVRVYARDAAGDIDPSAVDSELADQAPENLSLHPAGRFIYSINSFDDTISRFEIDEGDGSISSGALTTPGPTGSNAGRPIDLVFHPNGRYGYVSLEDESEIVRYSIDDDDGSLDNPGRFNLATSNGGSDTEPGPLGMHPSGRYLFVGERNTDTSIVVLSIDPGASYSLGFEARLPVAGNPTWIAVEPQGEFVYVRYADETVEVFGFDRASGTLSSTGQTVDAGSSGGFLGTLTIVAPLL